jgi:hypothetical protein
MAIRTRLPGFDNGVFNAITVAVEHFTSNNQRFNVGFGHNLAAAHAERKKRPNRL